MKIVITANLTDEQALSLAINKWYSPKVINAWDLNNTKDLAEIDNPQSYREFLSKVYESMIANDAIKHFIDIESTELRNQQQKLQDIITTNVLSNITSIVE